MNAAEHGHLATLQLLLDKGADIKHLNDASFIVLFYKNVPLLCHKISWTLFIILAVNIFVIHSVEVFHGHVYD